MRHLIFLHIPKTAGSTTHAILNAKYKKSEIHNIFGSRMDEKEVAAFIDLPVESKRDIKLLKGHMPFGLHQYLPGDSKYFGFVRNPVERIVSLYHYIRKNKYNKLHRLVVSNNMSIAEFIRSGEALGADNGQLRFLIAGFDNIAFGDCSEAHYKLAIQNIEQHFLFLGLTERFDESMLLLSSLLDWKVNPYYWRRNVRPAKNDSNRKERRLSDKDLEAIHEYHQLDFAIYKYACKRFDEMVVDQDDFSRRVSEFHFRNGIYQQLMRPVSVFMD